MEDILSKFGVELHKELYDVLMHSTPEEVESLCKEDKYKALCSLLKRDRLMYNSESDLPLHKLGRGQFKVVIDSFPEVSTALAYIHATHPAFIYTKEFSAYVKEHLKINRTAEYTAYVFGDLEYRLYRGALKEIWLKDGEFHRDGEPAIIEYDPQHHGVQSMTWYQNGVKYNNGDQSRVVFHHTGQVMRREWTDSKGKLHREDGPALILYDTAGRIFSLTYMEHGVKRTLSRIPKKV